MESGVSSTSERAATIAPAPAVAEDSAPRAAASGLRLAVNGVVMAPASKAALISVDDRPATLFVEGQQIVDGVVLYAVNADRVVVKRGEEIIRLPLRGVGSTENAAGAPLAEEPLSIEPQPTPPPGTEERRTWRSRD